MSINGHELQHAVCDRQPSLQTADVAAQRDAAKAIDAALLSRLKQVAQKFLQQHQEDAKLPFDEKHSISVMLAARPWMPKTLQALLRDTHVSPADSSVKIRKK